MENNVRLIDANALIKHYSCVEAQKSSAEKIRAEIIVQALEKAPTIDPKGLRPVARWELHGNDDSVGCSYFCSRCGFNVDEDYFCEASFEWVGCPRCGAQIEGGTR